MLAPLADAGLTKLEIRALAKAAGYTLWDRPAAPCLSFARGVWPHRDPRSAGAGGARRREPAAAGLSRVSRAPSWRAGARGDCARELPRALTMEMLDAITAALRQAGFQYVTLDSHRLPVRAR